MKFNIFFILLVNIISSISIRGRLFDKQLNVYLAMIISFILFVCSSFVYASLFFIEKNIPTAAGGLLGEAIGYAFIVIAPSAVLGKLTK